jgi:uncharacterized membrane protein YphA (DoxX/SURF4 family)
MPGESTTFAQRSEEPAGTGPIAMPVASQVSDRSPGERGSTGTERAALALGRALVGGYFIYNGINHFQQREMMAGYARSKGVPLADLAVTASGAMIVAGGLSLLTGTKPKVGASLIAAFLLGVTPSMHAFWTVEDQGQRMQEMINFTKNVALLGGAAFAAAVREPWAGSVDGLAARL